MKTRPILSLVTLVLAGCYTNTGTISLDPVSYFQLSNVKPGLTAIVDDNTAVALEATKRNVTLRVSPGKHRVRIMQGTTAIVDRVVLVSDLQTLEIAIP